MKRLGIIFGGRSGEHEVSLMSAASVINAIDKEKYSIVKIGIDKKGNWFLFDGPAKSIANGDWEMSARAFDVGRLKECIDFAFPVLHGPFGEDGTIQGLFEMLDIPYAGCGVLASAMAMDKGMAKDSFEKNGLPICKHLVAYSQEIKDEMAKVVSQVEAKLGFPVFVKPANMGSSVGISKANDPKQLETALLEAMKYDRRIVIEEGLDCREVETGVIGNYEPQVAAVGEIVAASEFYDYKAKYTDGVGTKLLIPAELSPDMIEKIRDIARKAYKALDCSGFSRVDFFVDKRSGEIYLNEINTIPGFTKYSMFPSLWREAGVDYTTLIEKIVEYGYERYHAKNNR